MYQSLVFGKGRHRKTDEQNISRPWRFSNRCRCAALVGQMWRRAHLGTATHVVTEKPIDIDARPVQVVCNNTAVLIVCKNCY